MIGLKKCDRKRTRLSHILNKAPARMSVDAFGGEREGKATADVESRVHVQTFFGSAVEDSVDLDEQTWFFRQWPWRIAMPLFPPAESGETISFEHPLHRRETYRHLFFLESVMQDLSTLISFCAQRKNPVNNFSSESGGVMAGTT